MKINCPECNELVPAKNIELKDKIAKCMNCQSIFKFNVQLEEIDNENIKEEIKSVHWGKSNELALTKGLKVLKDNDQLIIQRKWFSIKFIFLAFFLTVWDGISFTMFYVFLSSGEILPTLFMSLFCLIGISLTYFLFAGFMNTTVIKVTSSILSIRHGPLPWPGNEEGPSNGIKQIYVKENSYYVRSRHSLRRKHYFDYSLNLVSHSGQDVTLIKGLEKDQAKFIEKNIEKFLKIKDRKVDK